MAITATLFRFLVGTVFVLSGLAKLPRLREFEADIRRYDLLPPKVVRPLAGWLPVLELLFGLALLAGLGIRYVGAVICALLALFTLAIGVNLARGRRFDCGCLAIGAPSTIGWGAIMRNIFLLGMAAWAAAVAPPVLAVDGLFAKSPHVVSSGDALALFLAAELIVFAVAVGGEAVQLREAAASRRAGPA